MTFEWLLPEEIVARQQALLARIGMSADELHRRAADYTLTIEELAAEQELTGLEYLLYGAGRGPA